MSQRRYCPQCHYPQSVCLCAWIKPITAKCPIIVLQHPSEVKQAKNTLRLLQLSLTNLEIWVGESPNDFAELAQKCHANPHQYRVIFPNPDSHAVEEQLSVPENMQLILLDGTWRKAYKIWQLNPWLQALNSLHFNKPPASRYQIRKAKVENSLSTLEATAYCLESLYQQDCQSLYQLFEAMQQGQLQHRPSH